MKRLYSVLTALLLLLLPSFGLGARAPKYVFYLISDGMGLTHPYAAQLYNEVNGGPELAWMGFPVRTFVDTRAADSFITDSGAAGTSLASGVRTNVYYIGADTSKQPVGSIAMEAAAKGKGVGLVTTDALTQATPSAFYGCVTDRFAADTLNDQLLAADWLDFAAGASMHTGRKFSRQSEWWEKEAATKGINVFKGKYSPCKGRVIFLSEKDRSQMPYRIDSKPGDLSLSDFTSAAISHLYGAYARQGFFLMVEQGNIDHASHLTDAATVIKEINDMQSALDVVMEFCAAHPGECLVILTADHETGGVRMGPSGKYSIKPDILAHQKCSKSVLSARLSALRGTNPTWEQAKGILSECLGLFSEVPVSKSEEQSLMRTFEKSLAGGDTEMDVNLYSKEEKLSSKAIELLDSKSGLCLTTKAHTGAPTPLYVWGNGAQEFSDCRVLSDIPEAIRAVAGY